jgi:D-aspartate ligase
MDVSTPVVVLGPGGHGALGVVRSLGRLGIPVYALDSNPRMLAFSSKYCRGAFRWDMNSTDPELSITRLLEIAHNIGKAILIPTTDAAAVFVAKNSDLLQDCFTFPQISASLANSLSNKREMYFLAKRLGVPTPNTVFPQSRNEMLHYVKEARFPVMMKPIQTVMPNGRSSRKAIVASPEELIAKYDIMENPEFPNVMLQEYIPGGELANWMFNGYFDANSQCLFGLTGRKIRQHRPYAGVTTLGVCEPNQFVAETTERFMAAVGYRGILDIGYRYDARDSLYKVFDVNPRLGCTFRLFVSGNGMDAARALYLNLTGQPVASGAAPVGRRWLVEDLDLVSSFYYWREGTLSFKDWLHSFRGVEESALFARDDLGPMRRVILNDFRTLFAKRSPKRRICNFESPVPPSQSRAVS